MFIEFSSIFVADTKIIFDYNFEAPLKTELFPPRCFRTVIPRNTGLLRISRSAV